MIPKGVKVKQRCASVKICVSLAKSDKKLLLSDAGTSSSNSSQKTLTSRDENRGSYNV